MCAKFDCFNVLRKQNRKLDSVYSKFVFRNQKSNLRTRKISNPGKSNPVLYDI